MPPTAGNRAVIALVTGLALTAAGCSSASSSHGSSASSSSEAKATATGVTVDLTPQGCQPKPATAPAGEVDFTVTNKNATAVSEAELRTSDLSKILGEQENLTPGLSGGFSLDIQPGSYTINCPGAARQHWTFTVTGAQQGPTWQDSVQLAAAVQSYANYVDRNTADLVTHTQAFCQAIDAGDMAQAEVLYPRGAGTGATRCSPDKTDKS